MARSVRRRARSPGGGGEDRRAVKGTGPRFAHDATLSNVRAVRQIRFCAKSWSGKKRPLRGRFRGDSPLMPVLAVRSRADATTRRALGLVVFAVTVAGCWSFDYVESTSASTDAGADARARCNEGGFYCGGERLPGNPTALYRCNADGAGVLTQQCATACVLAPTHQPRKDDACSPATSCKPMSDYCGGDKASGDPDVLYRCNPGGGTSVLRRCPNGCVVNTNDDDTCK